MNPMKGWKNMEDPPTLNLKLQLPRTTSHAVDLIVDPEGRLEMNGKPSSESGMSGP